jgi:MazG family protein
MSSAGDEFTRLVAIMARLRGPDGCPWDREQTIDSLKKYVLEETYEVLEAIDRRDHDALREELGDFLLQAVFLAELEEEGGRFTIADVARTIADKLVRRHPHVFARDTGEPALDTATQVRTRWEQIKNEERGGPAAPKTLLGGIPRALPALLRAYQMGARAASVGFDCGRADDVMAKIREEVAELDEVVDGAAVDRDRAEEEMGDLLFSVANLARKLDIEPEAALRKACDKFSVRFGRMEAVVAATPRAMHEMTGDELEVVWQQVKRST